MLYCVLWRFGKYGFPVVLGLRLFITFVFIVFVDDAACVIIFVVLYVSIIIIIIICYYYYLFFIHGSRKQNKYEKVLCVFKWMFHENDI